MRTFLSHPINCVWARYFVLLGVMTFHLMALEAHAAPQAEQGILDLRDYSFERDGPVQLQGQWRMWWSTLASPYELLDEPSHSIRVPGVWTSLAETENSDVLLPAFGAATLKLEVLLPEGRLPRCRSSRGEHSRPLSLTYSRHLQGSSSGASAQVRSDQAR